MRLSRTDFVELRKNEEDLWRTEVRFSREKMDSLLDDAFVEVGASGRVYTREQTLNVEPQEIHARLPLPDFSAQLLASSVALVKYRSVETNADGTKREAMRTSIWKKKQKRWRIVFHQGTLAGQS